MEIHSDNVIVGAVLAIFALLFVATMLSLVTARVKLPFSVTLVCVGLGLGALIRRFPALEPLGELTLSPELITYIFMPTLIFQAAFAMNPRLLWQNLLPVLLLAVPAQVLSFGLVALGLHWAIGLSIGAALLFGALISSTDSAAVLAMFQELGAPKRLTVITQGENLLNDAAAIVIFNVVLASIGLAALQATTPGGLVMSALLSFAWHFFFGLAVGAALGHVFSKVIQYIENDDLIEILLTTTVAYLSMLVAELFFEVSGIMAVVGCALVLSGVGRTRYSAPTLQYLERFWEYLAFVANALIFLLIGIMIQLPMLFSLALPIAGAFAVTTLARALSIFALFPAVNRLPGIERVNIRSQSVLVWGGLRGGIALALALSLPETYAYRDTIVTLTLGVVLISLLGQGLTLRPLLQASGLQRATPPDLYVRDESLLTAKHRARERISELRQAGMFSEQVTAELDRSYSEEEQALRRQLDELRTRRMIGTREEFKLLKREYLLVEKRVYQELFHRGQLSERVLSELQQSIELQIDHLRYGGTLPAWTIHSPLRWKIEAALLRVLDWAFPYGTLAQRYRLNRIADLYEQHWGRLMASQKVLEELDRIAARGLAAAELVGELKSLYDAWHRTARARLDAIGEQFPEYATKVQQLMATRLCLQAEDEVIADLQRLDVLSEGEARVMRDEVQQKMRRLRQKPLEELRPRPRELLAKVPFFRALPPDEFDRIAELLRPRTVLADEVIVQEGEIGDSLFLIGRGVVRVTVGGGGMPQIPIATLLAGEFFGEMAMLTSNPRNATVAAVTHCTLYELRRVDLEAVQLVCPTIQHVLEATAAERAQQR